MTQGQKILPTLEPTESDNAYAAGFIDGEGCITVRANTQNVRRGWGTSCYASLTVSQTDYNRAVLYWMSDRWGGKVRKMAPPKNPKWAQGYEWCITSQMFYKCMDDVRPFLKIKSMQADNALRLRTMRLGRGKGNQLTTEERAMHVEISDEAKRLNQRRHD
jgi:hypothetical protein